MSEWISVKERLPENRVMCLCVNKDTHIWIDMLIDSYWGITKYSKNQDWEPTHWMPLPEPPKAEV